MVRTTGNDTIELNTKLNGYVRHKVFILHCKIDFNTTLTNGAFPKPVSY